MAASNDEIESKYEKSLQFNKLHQNKKHLLPIKTKAGDIIPQAMEVEEESQPVVGESDQSINDHYQSG